MDDEKIIDLFWTRDQSAVAELAAKYGRHCHRVALRILASRQDAEECVNDMYMAVWSSIPPNRPPNLFAYCVSVTRNKCFSYLRRSEAQKRGSGEYTLALDELSELLPSPSSVEEEYDAKLLAAAIQAFVIALPYDDKMIFLGRYWLILPVAEIAARLHCGKGKVKSSLFRSRRKLAGYLEREGLL